MKCINKSHPDYKALVENSGLNPTILNAKIMARILKRIYSFCSAFKFIVLEGIDL